MDQERIREALNKIRARTYGGSSICDSWVYHTLPFEGLPHIQSHRGKTQERWDYIKNNSKVEFEGKNIADLGCSVGAFSIYSAMEGAKHVSGYDYDPDSLGVASVIADEMKLSDKISFVNAVINKDFLERLPFFDIIFWLSQWMWVVKQYGLEMGLDMLFEIGRHTDTLIFESAANDAAAKIVGTTQDTIREWLYKSTAFSDLKDIGFVPGWHGDRHIHICKNPKYVFEGNISKVERISRRVVRKIYEPEYCWMIEREKECMVRLSNYRNFPRFISNTSNTLDMSYCGWISPFSNLSKQKNEILQALVKSGIVHRDIKPKNILRLGDVMYLIDFGWSLLDGEKDTPHPSPPTLGGLRYADHKWDDSYVMGIIE